MAVRSVTGSRVHGRRRHPRAGFRRAYLGCRGLGWQHTAAAASASLVCKLPSDAEKLPATARHGLIDHLLQYPAVHLASPRQRARARKILLQLVASAESGRWRDLRAARRAGYDTRTAPRKAGDLSVRYFHAERPQEPRRRSIFDFLRPKALIYANAPGRPLALVGAMWSTRDGERGPTPAGAILRWHSHVVCKRGLERGLKPPASGKCPPGARLTQGTSEMLHVWFTATSAARSPSAPRSRSSAPPVFSRGAIAEDVERFLSDPANRGSCNGDSTCVVRARGIRRRIHVARRSHDTPHTETPEGRDPTATELLPAVEAAFPRESYAPGQGRRS